MNRYLIIFLSLLGTAFALSGCNNEPGYSDQPPPAGGPQQNSHVPPGEKAGAAPDNSTAGH